MTDEFNNRTVTDIESDPVRALIGELKRTDAPDDFNFRVRARIAQGRPAERSQSWMPIWVKAAAPLGLALAVGGYLFSGALYTGNVEMQPVAGFAPQITAPAAAVSDERTVLPTNEIVASAEVPLPEPVIKTEPRRKIRPAPRKPEATGGSYDVAVRETREIVPVKNAADPANANASPNVNKTASAVTDLSALGIKIQSTAAGRAVISITPGSRAASSALRVGDVIESSTGGNLRIRRDGKAFLIVIK